MGKYPFVTVTIIITLFVVVSGAAGFYLGLNKQLDTLPGPVPTIIKMGEDLLPTKPEEVACTMEAKLCPDGSAVGRVPPDCEFAPCPGGGQLSSSALPPELCIDFQGNQQDPQTCANIPLEGRSCTVDTDCIATCSRGCLSREWTTKVSMIDCMAMPDYTCACINNLCRQSN